MKMYLVAAMALAMLAGSATTALADPPAGTLMGSNHCASNAGGTNLGQTATAAGPTSITITWTDLCDNEDEFHVLGWDGTAWTTLSGQTGTSFLHTGLTCETTYRYKLEAHKHGNIQNGNGAQLSESAEFTGTTGACDEGRAAPAIANQYLRSTDGAGTAAACEAKYEDSNNWHGEVISAVAQSELQGQTFTPAQESIVTTWVDNHCTS